MREESQTPEEELQEDVEEEFEEAIDELTGNEENEEEEENETGNGSGSEQGEDGNPFPEDLIPSVIDGKTQYISMLENLKEQAGQNYLTHFNQEQRDALNKYINNIDMELEGLK